VRLAALRRPELRICTNTHGSADVGDPMPRWQYRAIDLNDLPRGSDEIDVLNAAGADGWELVAIAGNRIAYMKRQTEDPADAPDAAPRRKVRKVAPKSPKAE
jgi:hypothetical protein